MLRDRAFMERLFERARAARCSARSSSRSTCRSSASATRTSKNGLTAPPKPTLANLLDLADQAALVPRHARHAGGAASATSSATSRTSATRRRCSPGPAQQFDPTLSWADVEWVKKRWGGKLILKGILDVEDARLAVASGADAIVVSNHGGRQLDGAPSSISALPAIADAVGAADRGLDGRRHPLRPGRAQGVGARRARHA